MAVARIQWPGDAGEAHANRGQPGQHDRADRRPAFAEEVVGGPAGGDGAQRNRSSGIAMAVNALPLMVRPWKSAMYCTLQFMKE